MKKSLEGFIWVGLGLSLLMVLFLSPHGSTSPDGLEKVAEIKGFKDRGEGWTLWNYAPFKDYALPRIKHEKTSKAVSGFIGTLAIFLMGYGVGKWLKKPRPEESQTDPKHPKRSNGCPGPKD